MTREQFERAKELDLEIQKCSNQISSIKAGISRKKAEDNKARGNGTVYDRQTSDHSEKWTLSKFFTLYFKKKEVNVVPHYEFAQGTALDAEPELIEMILRFLQEKEAKLRKEFEEIGGVDYGKR